MYKLTIISGNNRGASYPVQEGENAIGRSSGNTVVLSSSKVSKRHCVLVASNGELVVRDQGSSNGTFVNGVLTREKNVKVGDRISVGDFVLEVRERSSARKAAAPQGGAVIPFPVVGAQPGLPGMPQGGLPGPVGNVGALGAAAMPGGSPDLSADAAETVPQDLKGKLLFYFERFLMPIFYGLNQKNQWKLIGIGLFAAFAFANLVVSVQPLVQSGRQTVIREVGRRASYIAREIADRNAPFLAARNETKTEIGTAENADGVRIAVLTDLESRIIAPAAKLNQYLTAGGEAVVANRARDLFNKGRETGIAVEADADTVVAVEPVKVMSTQAGKNVTIGMAVVSIDTSLTTLGAGEIGVVYSETLIITAIIGGIILLILYRMTLKPLQILGDDIDKVLKGELTQITHEFKFEELDPLWDLVSSALQRIPRGSSGSGGADGAASFNIDEFVTPFRAIGQAASFGIFVCDGDRKVAYINPTFEEASGIRADGAVGQDIGSVARDQAFPALMGDLFDRAPVNPGGVAEDADFSGVSYRVQCFAYGGPTAKAYIVTAVRNSSE